MRSRSSLLLGLSLLALTACQIYPPTPKPDNTIKVVQTPNGPVAVPPTCLPFTSATQDPFDNQPLPQFGCANARNLAMMVENPNDLTQGRTMGPASGVTAVGSIARYNANQTRGLIWTGQDPNQVATTTASTSASAITGEMAGDGGGSSSGSSGGAAGGSASTP